MALNDLFRVTLEATYIGQDVRNVFYYLQQASNESAPASTLLSQFQTVVLPLIANLQSSFLENNRLLVQNLTNEADNAEDTSPTPATGARAGNGAPSFVAMAMRSNRPNLSERYSYKRFAGLLAADLTGSDFDAPTLVLGSNLAAVLDNVLASPSHDFTPVQVHVGSNPPLPPVYSVNYVITSWQAIARITTQNTRKMGHGD